MLNGVIGSAIYGLPSVISGKLGRAAPWAWLIAAALIGVVLACFAEVASRFRDAGGPYLYARVTFGRFAGLQTGWIGVALISLVLVAPLGTALIEPRRRTIDRLAREAPDGPLPQSLEQRIYDPVLSTALQTIAALLFGIVFLMTTKPALIGSLIVMAVALVIGLASGVLVSRATPTRGQNAAAQE